MFIVSIEKNCRSLYLWLSHRRAGIFFLRFLCPILTITSYSIKDNLFLNVCCSFYLFFLSVVVSRMSVNMSNMTGKWSLSLPCSRAQKESIGSLTTVTLPIVILYIFFMYRTLIKYPLVIFFWVVFIMNGCWICQILVIGPSLLYRAAWYSTPVLSGAHLSSTSLFHDFSWDLHIRIVSCMYQSWLGTPWPHILWFQQILWYMNLCSCPYMLQKKKLLWPEVRDTLL